MLPRIVRTTALQHTRTCHRVIHTGSSAGTTVTPLKLALIDCEDNVKPWDYSVLWGHALGSAAAGDTWRVYNAFADQLPSVKDLQELDAVFISGSHHSVLNVEKVAWIKALAQFITKFVDLKTTTAPQTPAIKAKLIGGCFGHQLIAHAIGGRVDRNPNKQFVLRMESIQPTAAMHTQSWAAPIVTQASGSLLQIQSHEDCVHELPPAATVLATSATAPIEMFSLGNHAVLGFQCHPEFTPAQAFDVIYRKQAHRVAGSEDAVRADLHRKPTTPQIAAALRAFIAAK